MLPMLMKRLAMLLLVIWAAATINFFIPRISDRNPIAERLSEAAAQSGGTVVGLTEMVASYEKRFGLDQPAWRQYLGYLGDTARGDLGYSIANYPMRVADQIAYSLPWTIGLLGTTTLLSFVVGSGLGALAGSRGGPRIARLLLPAFMVLSAIPFYLVGLVLIYFLAFQWNLFPTGGGATLGTRPELSWSYALDIFRHSLLPAFSIIVASIGLWAVSMRGMMVSVEGEDYMLFAEAKGLTRRRIFFAYGLRNALLPQITTLVLTFSRVVTGAILVEMVFGYPGIGNLLFTAIKLSDYFTIYGCVMVLVVTVAVSMLFMELVYPLLDPRTGVRAA